MAEKGHYAVGYELNLWLVLYSRWRALVRGVNHSTEFHRKDLWKVRLTVCYCVCMLVYMYVHVLMYAQVDLGEYENNVFFGVEQMVRAVLYRGVPGS